jgi:immune inhibitor A
LSAAAPNHLRTADGNPSAAPNHLRTADGNPRAQHIARDAGVAADPLVDFAPYDNDGNGFIDTFIVNCAGAGGEATGNPGDICSHKWTFTSPYSTDST